jgi:serine/threonine protein kinase
LDVTGRKNEMAQQKAAEPAVDEVDDLIDELQPGAKLLKGQYTITRYINSGGFGITYLAKDSLDRDVVIKECFPSSVCRRSKVMVAARSRAHTAELRSVIQLFVREARNLAKIVHPNIVSVHNVFEDNGTAYMALDFIDGLDLQQIIDGEGERPSPQQVVEMTGKLIQAVGFIHQHDMLHRDISPDNVLIAKTGEPILIDFGAAREKASQTNRAMSALRVVKDGYSPQEFYIAGSEQGPWSDLYALGATLYHLISDEAPVNGQARLGALAEDRPDPYVPLTGRFEGYPKGFLEAIDRVMSTLPKQRLQSADEWLAMYQDEASAASGNLVTLSEPVPGTDDAVQRLVSDYQREVEATDAKKVTTPDAVAPLARSSSRPAPASTAAKRGKNPVQLVAGIAAALVVVAGGYIMLVGPPAGTDATQNARTTTDPQVVAGSTVGDTTTNPTEAQDGTSTATTTASTETTTEPAATDVTPDPATGTAAGDTATQAATDANAEPADNTATVEETPAEDTATVDTAAADPATTEPATDTAVTAETGAETAVAPVGTPAEVQIGFAAWDVDLPFQYDDRIANGAQIALVTRVSPTTDLSVAGDWIAAGVAIHSVNGVPLNNSGSLTTAVLNAMRVDPDGKARVIVEYSSSSQPRTSGLLTVSAVRLISLQNGVNVQAQIVDGAWRTAVTGVSQQEAAGLQPGDILFRDRTTGIPLDTPEAIETILADLVAKGITQTEFSIIRENKVAEAVMPLALQAAP